MLLLAGNVRPSMSAPCGRRDLLTTGPGPDTGGSKPGKEGCDHMPEKFGIAACPTAGPAFCPKAGVAAATANIISKPKFRSLCMRSPFRGLSGRRQEMTCAPPSGRPRARFWSFDCLSPIGASMSDGSSPHLWQAYHKDDRRTSLG